MFAKLYRSSNRTPRRVPTQLSVEVLEGRTVPSTLGLAGGVLPDGGQPGGVLAGAMAHVGDGGAGVKVTPYAGSPGGVLEGSAHASVVHLSDGLYGAGNVHVIPFLSRSAGEEIPQ